MKGLNDNLPKAKYESNKCKTLKLIPEASSPELKSVKTSTKLPLPSLKNITSEKNLLIPNDKVPGSPNLK
jgi:hypothetical protein